MKPKISVIITTHDKYTDYLFDRCLPSVFAQTFTDYEVIVVKDGGKDMTDRINTLNAKNLQYIHLKKAYKSHPGPKNQGTLAANADWICYLDADNAYRPDHLAALWKAHEKQPPFDMIYGDRMIHFAETGKKQVGVKSDFSLGLLGQQNYIDTSDGIIRKQAVLDVGGWDENLKFFADWNLWVRMAKNGSVFQRIALVITDYYVHGANNVMKAKDGYNETWHFDNIQNVKLWPDKTSIGPRPKLKVAVYTLTMDRVAYLQEMMMSMRENTKYPFDHYILYQKPEKEDNTWKYLCDKEKEWGLKLYTEGKNLGISAGSNYLLDTINEVGGYDIIIKVDDDCIFLTDDWLETMIDCYERGRGVILAPYPEGLVDHPGGWPRLRDGYINTHYVGITEHVGGLCVAAPARCYKTFRWDENDFLHGQQDWMFSQKQRQLGFVPIYLENVRVSHGPQGTASQKENYPDYFERRTKVEKVTRYKK